MTFDFNANGGGEAALLEQLGFDNRDRYPYTTIATTAPSQTIPSSALTTMSQSSRQSLSLSPGTTWLHLDMAGNVAAPLSMHSPNSASATVSSPEDQQAQSPGYHSSASSPLQQQPSPFQTAAHPALLADWTMPQQPAQPQTTADLSHFIQDPALISFNPFATNFQTSPLDYLPSSLPPNMPTSLSGGVPSTLPTSLPATTQAALGATFATMSPVDDATQALHWGLGMANWQDFEAAMHYSHADGLPRMGSIGSSMGSTSPTGTYLEVLSMNSGSDNGWTTVDVYPNYDSYQQTQQPQNAAIFNPSQTLHLRSNSDSSQSDGNAFEVGSFEEVTFPSSPDSDTYVDPVGNHRNCFGNDQHQHSHDTISPAAAVAPISIKTTASVRATPASGSGATSPPARRNSGPRKSPIAKATKAVIRRTSTGKKDGSGEKKVGRRKGPLLPEQRKQASEIRKLRACLRCKFLKKTCDKGEPCAGCQPSHARLWQVPCTRIDIKDIGYFMKDWKADYERHLGRGVSVFNVKGFAQKETLMWITHGYGFCLPIMVREVYVTDESCFQADWVESCIPDQEPIDFEIRTERLDVGRDGVSVEALAEYLDKHIDGPFETFIDDHFEGTPFITEILKTAHRFYVKEKLPVIRKALKLILAYNLTLKITMVEQPPSEIEGQIDDEDSKFYGKYVAPVMINFQIKCAMADMWRELQKDILEELSALYSSVYSGDRLKNWPTIFMLASILLAVWEEMQFDCHYRVPDPIAVNKFCSDMETTPVGVIVGLFHAISQKLPAFTEWDTRRHGQLLNNNVAVCEAMTEVRQHVIKHG
jgi:hypothetical protein